MKAKRQARQRAKRRAWIAAEDAAKEEGIYRVEQEIGRAAMARPGERRP